MMNKNNRNVFIVVGVVIVLLLVTGFVFVKSRTASKQNQKEEALENVDVIPTVDSSVKVELEALPGKKEVILTVNGVPRGTATIDYELTYDAEGQGPQGAIGQCSKKKTEPEACDFRQLSSGKKITLGTCSSGTCVYHKVIGGIRLSLKFSGEYGEKIFEKDYDL